MTIFTPLLEACPTCRGQVALGAATCPSCGSARTAQPATLTGGHDRALLIAG